MTVQSLMRLCDELGIELALKGDSNDRLVVDAPKGALTEPLRQALTEHKAALISILKSRTAATASAPDFSAQSFDTPTPASDLSPRKPTPSIQKQPVSSSGSQLQRIDGEVNKLLSGLAYDANTVDANDHATREVISGQLVAALGGRNPLAVDCARRAFMNHGYFDDATRQLRTADSHLDRAAAARKLGVVGDYKATAHLVASLKDSAAEVRRASTEALGQIGDPAAVASLEDLLTRESNPQLPEAVIRHAINSIAVTQAKRAPAAQAPPLKPAAEPAAKAEVPRPKREIFADYLSSFAHRETMNVESPAAPVSSSSLEASVDRLFLEEETVIKDAEKFEQRRLEAETAQRVAEREARVKSEFEAQVRAEIAARKRDEEESYRKMLAEAGRQKVEEEARIRADEEARSRAEAEARKRAQEEERFRREADTLRKAAEELAQKRAEAAAARLRVEEEEARLRAQDEARRRALEDARRRAEDEARNFAEEEARRLGEEQVRRRVEEEIRRREEEEARERAEEEVRLQAEIEARFRAEQEQRRRVEEAQRVAEEQRLRAAELARQQVEEERRRLEAEERHRVEEARLRAERETLTQVAAELARRRAELEEARQNAETEARLLVEVQERTRADEESRRQMEIERQRLELDARRKADAELLELAERKAEAERNLAAEQARLTRDQEERHLAALNSMLMAAEQESRQRAETEERLNAEIFALGKAEEEQRARIEEEQQRRFETEARMKAQAEQAEQEAARAAEEMRQTRQDEVRRREELESQLKEEEARLEVERQAHEEARRLVEETRSKAEEEAFRRAEIEVLLQEEKSRLQSEQEATARAEKEAREFADQARMTAATALRRSELEARLKEEEARLQAEQEVRVKAEAEPFRLAEETRLRAQAAAASRAQVEARLKEEEARLLAEEEARAHAEAEARRLAQDSAVKGEAEARRLAEFEARIHEEARVRAEQEAREEAAAEAKRLADESRSHDEEMQALVAQSSDSELEAQQPEQLFEFSTPSKPAEEVAWVETHVQEDEHVLEALPVVDDSVYLGNDTLAEFAQEPAKAIDVVMAEKGIASAEDDAGIPSEVLKRLSSAQPAERAEALAEVVAIGGDDAFRCLCKAFDDQVVEVRNAAARALFNLKPDRAATFTRALREGTPERRRKIGQALAGSGLAGEAVGNLTGESREKTYDAFSLLFLMAKAGEVQPLMQAIEDYPNVEVRIAVVKLLALSGQPEIIPAFRRLAVRGSLPSEVRSAVMEAIYQISSQARESAPSAA